MEPSQQSYTPPDASPSFDAVGPLSLPPAPQLLMPEVFSQRITNCRERFLREDGRFTEQQICSISGSSDGFDETSSHIVSSENLRETGLVRVTVVSPSDESSEVRLPFQHFYPGYTQPLQPGDAEISRFLVAPESRKGKATNSLIEAAMRVCASANAERIFIDVVDGNLGVSPKSYERHFGFTFTGEVGYDDNYSCPTHLMVLDGGDKVAEISAKLTSRMLRR